MQVFLAKTYLTAASVIRHVNRDTSRWHLLPPVYISHTRLLSLLSKGPQQYGLEIGYSSAVPFVNSRPKESMNIVKWLLEATKFWGNMLCHKSNWNTHKIYTILFVNNDSLLSFYPIHILLFLFCVLLYWLGPQVQHRIEVLIADLS